MLAFIRDHFLKTLRLSAIPTTKGPVPKSVDAGFGSSWRTVLLNFPALQFEMLLVLGGMGYGKIGLYEMFPEAELKQGRVQSQKGL